MSSRDHELTVTRQAELLSMNRGSVYYLPRATSAADLALMRRIDELLLDHPFMDAHVQRDQFKHEGLGLGACEC